MTDYKITASSELMKNYRQAEVMAPEKEMRAVQSGSGDALLFTIGTNHEFYVTRQEPGSRAGWGKYQLNNHVTGDNAKLFGVAQRADGSIPLALATTAGGSDSLFLCFGNSSSETSWVSSPAWVAYPYDNPNEKRKSVVITGVYVSEASSGEYIVVDVLRDASQTDGPVTRYYIDPGKPGGYAWKEHDLAIDIDAGGYQSCLGKPAGGGSYAVEGIYTRGTVNGTAQLVYTPLYNAFDPGVAPSPSELALPNGAVPGAMAANWRSDETTDLFLTAGDALYCFGAGNQSNGAVAQQVLKSEVLKGCRELHAYTANGKVIVWGLNGDDQVFYTSCATDKITAAVAGWSLPLPILSGVEQVAPYSNAANSASTFFAQTGADELTVSVKSPSTTLWARHKVTLPAADPSAPAESFHSYTTQVQVDTEGDYPAAHTKATISTDSVVGVYVNDLYYVLDSTGVDVETDASGAITVVQPVDNVSGAVLTISVGASNCTINPMTKAFKKVTALDSVSALQNAKVTAQDGSSRPLVPAGTSTTTLQQVASSNGQITQAYNSLEKSTTSVSPHGVSGAAPSVPRASGSSLGLSAGHILADVGDLFSYLGHEVEKGVEHVIHLVRDAAEDAWSVIVTIAGKTYQAALKTVNAVVSAVEWVYSAIKTTVKDLLAFLEFLFELADIERTKKVVKNLLDLYLKSEVSQLTKYKAEFNKLVGGVEKDINSWAGLGSWNGLGPSASAPANAGSTPGAHRSAPGSLLSNHYRANASQTRFTTALTPPTAPAGVAQALVSALEQEGQVVGGAIEELKKVASSVTTTSLEDVLKQVIAVLSDSALGSVEVVVDALLDVLQGMGQAALDALAAPIDIPVVSAVLESFGVSEFSLLDVVSWVVAIPTTLAYKVTEGAAPFPASSATTFLMSASRFDDVVAAFGRIGQPAPQSLSAAAAAPAVSLSSDVAAAVFAVGHAVSGIATLLAAVVTSAEAAEESSDNEFAIASAAVGAVAAGSLGVANKLVPKDPIRNSAVSSLSSLITGVGLLCKLLFSGPAQKKFAISSSINLQKLAVDDARGVGAAVQAALVVPALFCTVWHFVELSQDAAGATRSAAILDETSGVVAGLSKVAYAVAVNTKGDPKAIAIAVLAGSDVCGAGLQIAESAVG